MHTKFLMTGTSLVLGLAGLILLFAPQEVVAALGVLGTPPVLVLAQLVGAVYAALALMNWTAKDSLIGGVYGRPITLGNFAHFFIGTLVLVRAQVVEGGQLAGVMVLIGYVVFALLFGWLVFGATGLRKNQT